MSNREQPVELGWWSKDHSFGSDMGLAKRALSEAPHINSEYLKNGYVTTTLYPNSLFFILFHHDKPAKKYFGAENASVFSVVDGQFSALYNRPDDKPSITRSPEALPNKQSPKLATNNDAKSVVGGGEDERS